MKRKIIGLLWHSSNSENLGVGALTQAQISIVRAAAKHAEIEPYFLIISWDDPTAPYISGPDIEQVGLRMKDFVPGGLLGRSLKRCDVILDIGAGDSFSDIYGANRVSKYLYSKALSGYSKAKVIISPQTIGPFKRSWIKYCALTTLNKADHVCTRDAQSTDYLRDIGYTKPVLEATDVAMRLPYDALVHPAAQGPHVGINISGLLLNGGYTQNNMFALQVDFEALMHQLIAFFSDTCGACVHLIGHVNSMTQPIEDDYGPAQAFAKTYPNVIVAPRFASPSDAKSYIAGLDFFTGARMHACIAAFSSGVPVVPLAYSRKFSGLFGSLGYGHTADCTALDTQAVFGAVKTGFTNRAALKRDVESAYAKADAKLAAYDALLVNLLSQDA